MSFMVFWTALAALLGCFVAFAVASYRHFLEKPSLAHGVVRMATLGCTAGFAVLAIIGGPVWWAWSSVALVLAAMSYGLFAAALRATQSGTFDVAFSGSGPDSLNTGGVYGYIRNPFYAAYLVYWGAWAVLLGLHWTGLLGLAGFVGLYVAAVRQEEAFLSGQFGEEYAAYRGRTGRFFPRLP